MPFLAEIQQAVWENHLLQVHQRVLGYIPVDVVMEPYALVAKAGVWYLVGCVAGGMRVYRVAWFFNAHMLDQTFDRQPEFDLPAFWKRWCATYEESQESYLVTLRISPQLFNLLPLFFGSRSRAIAAQAGPPDDQGWVTLTLPFESLEAARERVMSFGSGAEIIAPEALRSSVVDYARQIVSFYEGGTSSSGSARQ